jgi:hypothetical protein
LEKALENWKKLSENWKKLSENWKKLSENWKKLQKNLKALRWRRLVLLIFFINKTAMKNASKKETFLVFFSQKLSMEAPSTFHKIFPKNKTVTKNFPP